MTPSAPQPAPLSSPRRPMTRRALLRLLGGSALGAVAGAGLTGCRSTDSAGSARRPSASGTGGGARDGAGNAGAAAASAASVARRVADDEQTLLAAYDDALAGHPELAAKLSALRADHVRHLSGLVAGATPTAIPSPRTPSAPDSSFGPSAPSSAAAASASASAAATTLARLADLEHDAAAKRVADLMAAPASLARLIASIGGCEAAHSSILRATR